MKSTLHTMSTGLSLPAWISRALLAAALAMLGGAGASVALAQASHVGPSTAVRLLPASPSATTIILMQNQIANLQNQVAQINNPTATFNSGQIYILCHDQTIRPTASPGCDPTSAGAALAAQYPTSPPEARQAANNGQAACNVTPRLGEGSTFNGVVGQFQWTCVMGQPIDVEWFGGVQGYNTYYPIQIRVWR